MKKATVFICLFCLFFSLAVPVRAAALLGDADGDGIITPWDARAALRVVVKLDETGSLPERMDVDGDGGITAEDARLILRRAVELDAAFPVELPFAPPAEGRPLNLSVAVPQALLYSVEDNRLLYQKNIDSKTAPASLIKLLTALTALKYCSPDQIFTVGDEIDLIGWDSSVCDLEKGWQLSLRQLLCGMLIPSGNDAAYCVAANVARRLTRCETDWEAVDYFVGLMNQTAKELGMFHTNVRNPDGYDTWNQYTTARDLLTLTRAVFQNELIVSICGKYRETVTLADGTEIEWYSTNRFLNPSDRFYDARVTGLKSGFTYAAGCCLITTCIQMGQRYIIVVMGSETFEGRFEDTAYLINSAALYQSGVPFPE